MHITEHVLSEYAKQEPDDPASVLVSLALGDVAGFILEKGKTMQMCGSCNVVRQEDEKGKTLNGEWFCSSCVAMARMWRLTNIGKLAETIIREEVEVLGK